MAPWRGLSRAILLLQSPPPPALPLPPSAPLSASGTELKGEILTHKGTDNDAYAFNLVYIGQVDLNPVTRPFSMASGLWRKERYNCSMLRSLPLSTNAFDVTEAAAPPQPRFNRAVEKRSDSNWLSEAFDSSALVIPLLGSKNLVKCEEPVFLPSKNFSTRKFTEMGSPGKPIFLGLAEDTNKPIFAVDISAISSADFNILHELEGSEWIDLRRYGSQLPIADAGLLAYARGMVEWHRRNKFCGHCGGKMESKGGGHNLQCSSTSCGNSAYPRLDPAIIVLVTCGEFILLGRQSRWDQGRYSLLAGFVEVGETFETAVAREVHEETGVHLDHKTIRYIASQPWPFPSSLMVGFIASAKYKLSASNFHYKMVDDVVPIGDQGLDILRQQMSLPSICVDSNELEDARWIHKSFLHAVLQGFGPAGTKFSVPGKHAIAHFLMNEWIAHDKKIEWAGSQLSAAAIDEGVFKYVLARVYDGNGNEKLIVRGNKKFSFHSEIFNNIEEELKDLKLQVEVLGGGRIKHVPSEYTIHVYGFSQAYGRANHGVTVALIQQWYPLHKISLSWDGY